ncbi:hypothetical protein HBH42_082310 [Parastagonospora nodorum]|nr:hypothetical protein HBH42_082310 [Parastagonospora nodorum]
MAHLLHFSKEFLAVPDLSGVEGSFDLIPCGTAASSIVRGVLGLAYGVRRIRFSHLGGSKQVAVHNLREVFIEELGSREGNIGLKEWLDLARQAGMGSEMIHIFEEVGEHVKSLVFPEVERSQDLV